MQLTTEYQMLGQAYLGNSAGDLYIRIYAKYSELDISNNRSKVQYQARAYFSGSYIYDQQSSGNVVGTGASQVNYAKSGSYYNGETVLGTTEAWVTHNQDGTMSISASAFLNFPNWGWSATASGNANLPTLHKVPRAVFGAPVENNQTLNQYISPYIIVQYLSNKTFTFNVSTYDGATLNNNGVKLIYAGKIIGIGIISSYTQSSDRILYEGTATVDFRTVGEINEDSTMPIEIQATDSLNAIGSSTNNYQLIKYIKPTYDGTKSKITRFTGYSSSLQRYVSLTDNIVSLNFNGIIYPASFAANKGYVYYKVWERGSQEPSNYNGSREIYNVDGIINITDLLINNIDYLKVYKYKLLFMDMLGGNDTSLIIEGEISTGVPVWSEYKDRVDFLKLTVGGYNPFEYNENDEIIVGIYNDGNEEKPIYRQVFVGNSTTVDGVAINLASLDADIILNVYGWVKSSYGQWWPINNHYPPDAHYDTSLNYTENNMLNVHCESYFSYPEYRIVLEYTKTTD